MYRILKNIDNEWTKMVDFRDQNISRPKIERIDKGLHFCCIDARKPIFGMELPCGGLKKSGAGIFQFFTFSENNTSLVVNNDRK